MLICQSSYPSHGRPRVDARNTLKYALKLVLLANCGDHGERHVQSYNTTYMTSRVLNILTNQEDTPSLSYGSALTYLIWSSPSC